MRELGSAGEVGCNVKLDGFIYFIVFVDVIIIPHGDTPLAGFVVLYQEEAGLIKNYKTFVCNSPLLWSEERKKLV